MNNHITTEVFISGTCFLNENVENSSCILNLSLSIKKDWMAGFTWKTMHEIGHAIGLQHPHQGFSWDLFNPHSTLSGMYYYWLWDFSYSQVNYANNAPTISMMDIDTVRRGMILGYWRKTVEKMQNIIDLLNNPNFNSLDNVSVHLMKAIDLLNRSIAFYLDINNSIHYHNSLQASFSALRELDYILKMLKKTETIDFILPITIGSGAILIFSTSYIIIKSFKRKLSLDPERKNVTRVR